MIIIVDYKAGNLPSVERAVRHLGHGVAISDDPAVIRKAERIIFPGVGAAGQAMAGIRATGIDRALQDALDAGTPVLGICLGTQIIFETSEENLAGCLGILPGRVRRFPDPLLEDGRRLKVPHMGWNRVDWRREHPLLTGLEPAAEYYFVHSYYPELAPGHEDLLLGTARHGIPFAAAVARDNLVAVQFHPEKSGAAGLRLLDNFCRWTPSC